MNYETVIPGLRLAAGFLNIVLFTVVLKTTGSIQDTELKIYALICLPIITCLFAVFRPESIGKSILRLAIVGKDNEDLKTKERLIRAILPVLALHVFTINSFPEGFYDETLTRILSPLIALVYVANGAYVFVSSKRQSIIDLILGSKVLKMKKIQLSPKI